MKNIKNRASELFDTAKNNYQSLKSNLKDYLNLLIEEVEQKENLKGRDYRKFRSYVKDYPPVGVDPEIAQYYANLEVPYNSDAETVKTAYRTLMKKFHPDRFTDDPAREKIATALSQELTHAYNEIEEYLRRREKWGLGGK